jgi:hypothetical protein
MDLNEFKKQLEGVRLHEMAYGPWVANQINIKNLQSLPTGPEISDETKASLKKLAKEWEFSKSEGSDSLMNVIQGELLHNKRSKEIWDYLEKIGELDAFKQKIAWIQRGLDSGDFLNYE